MAVKYLNPSSLQNRRMAHKKTKRPLIGVRAGTKKSRFKDECVIYYSRSDECWIAHGLHTDQIGTGSGALDALVEFMEGIDTLLSVAQKHKDIDIYREAPHYIQKRAQKAYALPEELYGIASKKVRGYWPDNTKISIKFPKNRSIKTDINDSITV
jgi:hypothetical protein